MILWNINFYAAGLLCWLLLATAYWSLVAANNFGLALCMRGGRMAYLLGQHNALAGKHGLDL